MAAGSLRRSIRQSMTVARRDFIATVFTPTFLIFLLSPMLTIVFGTLGGLGASTMARGAVDRARIVVIAASDQGAAITAADRQLRVVFGGRRGPPPLEIRTPAPDPAKQARTLVAGQSGDVDAVLYGTLAAPTILYAGDSKGAADYLGAVADRVLLTAKAGSSVALSKPVKTSVARTDATPGGHSSAAMSAVFAIFLLTLFLAGLTMGTMAEERSNKVIEVLAAAVPLESVFFGKLIGMFGVALLFVGFWGIVASQVVGLLPAGLADLASVVPAVGKPAFALLFLAYFVMSYLLIGAVYLILGAQASTQRELQLMALPMTIAQMAIVGISIAAAGQPGGMIARIAEIFPFSSPMAMAAHAANAPELWPHLVAIAWQLLWVSIVIALGARWFRRGVLKSGSAPRRKKTA